MRLLPWLWHVGRFTALLFCRVRLKAIIRREGGVPQGPTLVCAKHASGFDIPLLAHWSWQLRRDKPYFQMGSFIGYRVLGPMVPLLKRLGGFCVMRPKEVLRLRKKRWERERLRAVMQEINAEAERVRTEVLRAAGTLIVFPEGTRDAVAVKPLVSELELRSAVTLAREGLDVSIWPAILSYGPPRFFRRPVVIEFQPAFPLGKREPADVLQQVDACFRSRWMSPDEVQASIGKLSLNT